MMKNNNMKSKTQTAMNIKDVYPGNNWVTLNQKTNRTAVSAAPVSLKETRKTSEQTKTLNIFLAQNKGKGPPGRQRSPGTLREHPPDVGITPDRVWNPVGGENPTNFENYLITKNKYNFLIHFLNFTKMKKHLFFLILAVFASVTVAFGQNAAHHASPNPLTCGTNDALHPIAGKPYNYNVGINPTPSATASYTWWATKGTDFILNGTVTNTGRLTVSPGQLLSVDPTAGYGVAGNYSTMTITWSSEILAATVSGTATGSKTPTFVVVNYTDPATACANNLKVYQLDPINGFTVDIFNRDASGTLAAGATTSSCVSNIASVTYNGTQLLYDYGTNTITYEVVAANFSSSWTPEFQVSALGNGQTADLQWAYDDAFTSGLVTVQSGIPAAGGTYTSTTVVNTNVADTSIGVSIFVRLIIHSNTYEGITDTPIALAVNGVNSAGQPDVVNTDCNTSTYMEDIANQTLTKRPTVTDTTPSGGFVPANTTN
jgi:hypothetical protein